MFVDNNPIEFSSEAMDAEVTGIPNRDEVLKFGEARLSIKNFAKGGMVVMKSKSRRSIAMSPELVTSDKPKIAIVSANYLHNYF